MALDKDDIKQLIAILQRGLDDDDTPSAKTKPEPKRSTKTTKKKTINLFDSMSEASMHKDDVEIDKRLKVQPITQRSRNYKPLTVRCRVCGKEEKVNPSLVESIERYKCNKCSTSAG